MYLSIYRCLLFLLSFGIPIALSITVENVASATLKLGENASMIVTYTLEFEEIFLYLSWFGCDADGVMDGDALITNIGGNVKSKDSRYSLNSDGDFIITNVRANDTGYYGCEVRTNNDRKDYGYNLLTVNYLETPTLELKENNIEVGEIATFTCPSPNGVPMPIIITWIKDDGVLDVSDTEKYPQSDTTLQITGVNEMDEGDYQCRAENAAYSGDEGKLSIKETLTLFPSVPTVIDSPTTTLTTKATSTKSSQQTVTHKTIVTSMSTDDEEIEDAPVTVIIIGVVIGLVVLVALVSAFSYKNDKLCFSRNATKASGGASEKIVLSSNFSDVDTDTYAQVQKPKKVKAADSEHSEQAVTETKPPDKPQRAPSRDRANVEQLTYADLDLVKNEAKVIRTDPETEDSSVRTEKQLTYADLDLTKDVNIGSKDKIIRTQPETEYSSVMITKK